MAIEAAVDKISATTAVVTLTGSLTLGTNLKIVDTRLQQLVEGGVQSLVLDMSHCLYSDSAGLGTLIHFYGLLQQRGGTIRLCGASERVAALLRLTKTDVLLPTDPSIEASLSVLE